MQFHPLFMGRVRWPAHPGPLEFSFVVYCHFGVGPNTLSWILSMCLSAWEILPFANPAPILPFGHYSFFLLSIQVILCRFSLTKIKSFSWSTIDLFWRIMVLARQIISVILGLTPLVEWNNAVSVSRLISVECLFGYPFKDRVLPVIDLKLSLSGVAGA